MKKAYTVITFTKVGEVYIEYFSTYYKAKQAYFNAIDSNCKECCLLETITDFSITGDSLSRILSKYENKE